MRVVGCSARGVDVGIGCRVGRVDRVFVQVLVPGHQAEVLRPAIVSTTRAAARRCGGT